MNFKQKILAVTAVILGIAVLVFIYVILPVANDIKKIHDTVYLERIDLERKYQRGQLLRQTIENFEKIAPLKTRLSAVFIFENQELELITALEKIAAKNSLDQTIRLNPAPAKKNELYRSVNLALALDGKFENVIRYLHDLNTLDYQINISGFSLKTSGSGRIAADISAQTYMLLTAAAN